jgi:uncharacterized repeat protein (TIGR03803 family)
MKNIQRLLLATLVSAIFTCTSFAQYTATVLHTFSGTSGDGIDPNNSLIMDSAGNLYSTTSLGGSGDGGVAYELSPSSTGWTENILASFVLKSTTLPDWPTGPLILDASGNLYGVAQFGGSNSFGAVYELSPNSSGWMVTVLYSFAGGSDGQGPTGSLTFDSTGNLYGTTPSGGGTGGTVFELSPSSSGWTKNTIYTFTTNAAGQNPGGNLLIDSTGRVYGAASGGGSSNCSNGCGTIFRLTPASGTWHFARLFDFQGTVGGWSPGNIVFDAAGNIYGTTALGGSATGGGVVFKLSPTASGGPWKEKVLHAFTGQQDGDIPSGIVFDFKGNLFGTTAQGAKSNEGVVWELSPTTSGPWTFTQIFAFGKGTIGYAPSAGVIVDTTGNLYGVTTNGPGTAFELSPPATE